MSDTKTAKTEQKKPQIEIRPITRNDVSITPVQREIKRGECKDMQYVTVEATPENLTEVIKFFGVNKVCDLINGRINLDAQETIYHVLKKNDALKCLYKVNPETGKTIPDSEGQPIVEKYFYNVEDLPLDEYYDLLTKGTVRGGVTIKDLSAENDEMQAELLKLVPLAMTDVLKPESERDPSLLIRASELSTKIAENNETIARIQADRARARQQNKEESKAA